MKYFVMQVKTGSEEQIKKALEEFLAEGERLISPQRELYIQRKGKKLKEKKAAYPGYLFLETEDINPEMVVSGRKINGFYHFLKNNGKIQAIRDDEVKCINPFLSKNQTAGISKVTFDENNRIVVKEGPLKGLEGCIVKVDRRKRRARVVLDMYKNSYQLDFSFDILNPS